MLNLEQVMDVKFLVLNIKNEICAIMCFGFANEIPKTINEFDLMTRDAHLQSAHGEIKMLEK